MADLLVETMHMAGVTHAFAMPAESLNPILDAIRKSGVVQLITVRHEGYGALMASACAKLTGRLSVCMGTAGPGASHLPLGTYDAKADGAPLLAVTGQVPIHQVGSGGFQEIDSVRLLDDSVIFNHLVASPHQTALVPLACAQAIYRRGPAHLAFPSDVLGTKIERKTAGMIRPEWLTPGQIHEKGRIRQAADKLSNGSNAVVLVGRDAGENIRESVEMLADRLRAPILVAPEGMHYLREQPQYPTLRLGAGPENQTWEILRSAGQIVLIGTVGASIYTHLPPFASLVQVASSGEAGRPVNRGFLRVLGDIPEILQDLVQQVRAPCDPGLVERAIEAACAERNASTCSGKDLWSILNQSLPADAILALEPGPVFDSAFFSLCLRQRTVTTSFHQQVRGYALPAAIAATLVYPERAVWAVATQEGLAESMADFLSARKHSIPVKTICVGPAGGHEVTIDFCRFARASGYQVYAARDASGLAEAIQQCNQKALPAIVCTSWKAAADTVPQVYEVSSVKLPDRRPDSPAVPPQTFASFLIEALHRARVRRIFGPSRPSIQCFLQQLKDDGRISFVPVTHPESASIMASAYSKWTGEIGVCLIGDERDIVHQLNGLYDAAFDRNPVIILTACAARHVCLDPVSAPADSQRLLTNIVASSIHINPGQDACRLLEHSLRTALQGRCVTHVCFEWRRLNAPSPAVSSSFDPGSEARSVLPPPELLAVAAKRLSAARRPIILVGRGAHGSQKEIIEISELLRSPIVATMPGRGAIPDDSPQFAGAIGASGHRAAIEAVRKSDVLLVLGSSNRGAVFGLKGRFLLVQIDSDPLQLGRRSQESLGLHGTVKETLQELIRCLTTGKSEDPSSKKNNSKILLARAHFAGRYRRKFEKWQFSHRQDLKPEGLIPPAAIIKSLATVLASLNIGRPVVAIDVGVTTVWAYRHLIGDFDFLWTSSFATMGFALPAAIAVRDLEPSRPVIAIAGDGGIGITMAELLTAARLNLPITVIVFNNGKLAAIKYEQEVMGWPEYQSGLFNCDFAEYARSCGAKGIRVTRTDELTTALQTALTCKAPCVVDVVCDPHAMPAPPRIHPLQAAGYLLAVSREVILGARNFLRHGKWHS